MRGWEGHNCHEGYCQEFVCKLSKGLRYVLRVIITDKLKSYSAAKAEVMPGVEHLQCKFAGVENKGSLGYIPKLDVAGSIAAPNLY
jgi:hypothetical protein